MNIIDKKTVQIPSQLPQCIRFLALPSLIFGITVLGATLRIFDVSRAGLGNLFYASTVYSMGQSMHNFLYGAYDPLGTFIVDKPPVALWIQTLFSKVIGFNGYAMILPMAIAGTIAIPLLYYASKKAFGRKVGILSALLLAIFPVSVATSRDSTMDAMLMMVLVIASIALIHAVEKISIRWLILWAIIMGIAFNIKFFQAYIVLPAALVYIFLSWREPIKRAWHKWISALTLMAVVSLSWAIFVDLTPEQIRPRVMNSQNNTVLNLIFEYNGLNRVVPQEVVVFEPPTGATSSIRSRYNNVASLYGVNNRGLGRLFIGSNGVIFGVVTILSITGGTILILKTRRKKLPNLRFGSRIIKVPLALPFPVRPQFSNARTDSVFQSSVALNSFKLYWLVWGTSGLLTYVLANRSPVHYAESFSPALVVLAAYGISNIIRIARIRVMLMQTGFITLICGYAAAATLAYSIFFSKIIFAVVITIIGSLLMCILAMRQRFRIFQTGILWIVTFSLIALPFIPSLWITTSAPRSTNPITRPNPVTYARNNARITNLPWIAGDLAIEFASRHSKTRYTLAVDSFNRAGRLTAQHKVPILTIWNSYTRQDLFNQKQIQKLITDGEVRFFLTSTKQSYEHTAHITNWLQSNCFDVGDQERGLNQIERDGYRLWDCKPN